MLQSLDDVSEETWVTHRNTYRGKNLGSEVTEEQIAHIHDGSFKDLYVGDYWEIDGDTYYIADINYYYKRNNSNDETYNNNHLLIVMGDNADHHSQFNTTRTTSTGYLGSYIRTTYLSTIKTKVVSDFQNIDILKFSEFLTNGYSANNEVIGIWQSNLNFELMGLDMIYGIPSLLKNYNYYQNPQIAIYRLNPSLVPVKSSLPTIGNISPSVATRDIAGQGYIFRISQNGDTTASFSEYSYYARPYFCIG